MIPNRSMPDAGVIPELAYWNVGEAIDWLCEVFRFTLRLRIGNHRAQLNVGVGAVILTEANTFDLQLFTSCDKSLGVMVRVDDVDRHYERASRFGAAILRVPADHPYGERQYSCRDLGGYVWTFSQSIADVAPEAWGGSLV